MPSIVSCVCWVEKGKAKQIPDKVELDKNELDSLLQDRKENQEVEEEEEEMDVEKQEVQQKIQQEVEQEVDVDRLYQLDKYESDDEIIGEKTTIGGLAGLTFYSNYEDDPYITLKVDEDDEKDLEIQPDDNLLLVGKAEDEFSSIEVHVFNEKDNHIFCHHEILINAYPLALEWIDYDLGQPEEKGNFVAVGTMSPAIEIWDLDLLDALEPVGVLGMSLETMTELMTLEMSKKKKKKKDKKSKKKKKHKERDDEEEGMEGAAVSLCDSIDGHFDAVMGLAWNKTVRTLLASASADSTVKLWDLSEQKTLLTLQHPDKVQCLNWHPFETSLLATGCYDGIVRLFNCEDGSILKHWKLKGEIEKLIWNHFQPDLLLASTEQCQVYSLNKSNDALHFTIHAHTEAITDISMSCQVSGLLVTSSTDDTVKYWDIHGKSPVFLYSRTMHMGSVLCSQFCKDNPYMVAVGGQKNGFQVLNILSHSSMHERCKERGLSLPESTFDPTGDTLQNDDGNDMEEMENDTGSDNKAQQLSAHHVGSGKSIVKKKKEKHKKSDSRGKKNKLI